jgi:hypothetical protein
MRHERGPGAALDELFDDLGAEGRAVVGAAASYQGCPGNTLGRYRTLRTVAVVLCASGAEFGQGRR